jgi:hypothetical protein
MAWLVDRALPSPPQHTQPRMQSMGGRITLVTRDAGMMQGGRGGFQPAGRGSTRGNARPVPGGGRVCRYYLAGECLRADCRFRFVRSLFFGGMSPHLHLQPRSGEGTLSVLVAWHLCQTGSM